MKRDHRGVEEEPGAVSEAANPAESIEPNPLTGLRRQILRPRTLVPRCRTRSYATGAASLARYLTGSGVG